MVTHCIAEPLAGRTAAFESVESRRSLGRGLLVFTTYTALYLFTLVDALAPFSLWASLFFSVGNGLMISMLFIIGHDCQHRAFVPGRRWNLCLGRLAFLPCLHAGSLWRQAHNVLHHGRTNLKGADPVWAPMSMAEYRAASPARRLFERVCRSWAGPLFYYYAEFWPFTVLLPFSSEHRGKRLRHLGDSLFVLTGFASTIAAILVLGHALSPQRPIWLVLLLGWALPFAFWNYLGAVSFYLNHTHPDVPWFDEEDQWRSHGGALATTVHMKLPINVLPLYASCMAHTAHHDRPSTPIYALEIAQASLKQRNAKATLEYTFSIREYRRILAVCKLFDFERMCWADFSGKPTTPRLIPE